MSPERPYGPYSIAESDVGSYHLPDPLQTADGGQVTDAASWSNRQRAKIFKLFVKHEYGEVLPRPDAMWFELLSQRDDALNQMAIRKEIRIHCAMRNGRTHAFDLLLYLPRQARGPVPVFVGLNFKGNHNTTDEADVAPTGFRQSGVLVEAERGLQTARWQFAETIRRGFASATVCYHDIHPDFTGCTGRSAFRLFYEPSEYDRIGDRHSVIGAWAWGLSRCLDYLESDPAIAPGRVAVHGHSRLGKTSLWAGAADTRFKLVISNDSGCGGGSLHKRKFGENLSQHFAAHVQHGVPPWFVRDTERYIWREEDLPMDQHELIALMAPRPVCIGTATEDFNADPHGEFLACRAANPVYRLFGSAGLTAEAMLAADTAVTGDISFHYRTGKHDQTRQDWEHYWEVADRYL